jgi:DNA-binding CsgD family transcriptional regulator
VAAARGEATRLARVLDRSPVPLVMVDDQRRFAEVNRPARLLLRLPLAKVRALRIDDLASPSPCPGIDQTWARFVGTGSMAGAYEVAGPDGGRLDVVHSGLANAFPGLHVIAFAPAGWPADELALVDDDSEPSTPLTPRELVVLQLAAEGCTGPRIADELVVSPMTVRTHFRNIRRKLGVTDRTAAVAKAMRLGLID